MRFFKTLGVLGGVVLLGFIATLIGFEFIKPFVMPNLAADLASDIEGAVEPVSNPLGKLIMGGAFLVILNWIFGLNKWLHKGINLLINAPLALAAMAAAIYGGYSVYLVQTIPDLAHLGNLFALFVLSLFWLLISVKVNLLGKHLFHPKDWAARKKVVDDVIDKVQTELGVEDAPSNVPVVINEAEEVKI